MQTLLCACRLFNSGFVASHDNKPSFTWGCIEANWQNGGRNCRASGFSKCSGEQPCPPLARCRQPVSERQVGHRALWLVSSLSRDGRGASCFWVGGGHADWPTEPPRIRKRPSGRDHRNVSFGNCTAQITLHCQLSLIYMYILMHCITSEWKMQDTSVVLFLTYTPQHTLSHSK